MSTLAAFLVTMASVMPSPDSDARDLLERALGRAFGVNIVAIISQRDPRNEGSFQTVSVERDKTGRTHHTILQPLRMQGVESVDDLVRFRMYMPDQAMIIDQDSPQRMPCDARWRTGLAVQNYELRLSESSNIAGRRVTRIEALPRFREIPSRRYYVDATTGYPLRLELMESDGAWATGFDTKDIRFPRSIEPGRFRLEPMGEPKVIRYENQNKLSKATAAKLIGFEPIVPPNLPFGFQVQSIQTNDSKNWRSLAMRLTDGLARATIYQWQIVPGARDPKSIENSTMIESGSLRIMLVSDLPVAVRKRLLEAFSLRAEMTGLIITMTEVPPAFRTEPTAPRPTF
jgi:negative regulator of sigma E activity